MFNSPKVICIKSLNRQSYLTKQTIPVFVKGEVYSMACLDSSGNYVIAEDGYKVRMDADFYQYFKEIFDYEDHAKPTKVSATN